MSRLKCSPVDVVRKLGERVPRLRCRPRHLPMVQNYEVRRQYPLCSLVVQRFQESDEENVNAWMAYNAEDCGFQMLYGDEFVMSVQEESDPVDDETDENEDNNSNESSKGPFNADAFSALETAMEYTNNNQSAFLLNYCCSRESEILH
ncbi:uncharacterized protein TNCV_1840531 [Trichonephila clavipes]|nr:uncharacterized protein TNCV_1840531 [Trichonephila clavipes]